MRQLTRLVRYVIPYWWQFILSVVLMAGVGLLDAFRVLLVGPILDRVLNPASGANDIKLFTVPGSHHIIYLQRFVPTHLQNSAWSIVAYAFVASTILKGICDYTGTYLVNYAGFGMITDLRNDLYESDAAAVRGIFSEAHYRNTDLDDRSMTLNACSMRCPAVLAEFLQQFFTFLFTAASS